MVARLQLREAGVTRKEIEWLLRDGTLTPVHRGVYLVGPMPATCFGRFKAAALALSASAVSHPSALELWSLIRPLSGPVHVIRVGGGQRPQPGLVVHRARPGSGLSWVEKEGIAVVAPTVALVQSAGRLGPGALRQAFEEAEIRGLLEIPLLDSLLADHPNLKARHLLRATAEPFRKELTGAESPLEIRFHRWCHERRLPMPGVNVPVDNYVVDFLWPHAQLIVETDGFQPHRSRTAFDKDRARWAHLSALGFTVIVVTDHRLRKDGQALYGEITMILRRAGLPLTP